MFLLRILTSLHLDNGHVIENLTKLPPERIVQLPGCSEETHVRQ
jgi:hypothetical protein